MDFIEQARLEAERGAGKLSESIFAVDGFSGRKGRLFLNNICQSVFEKYGYLNYLEIGSYKGSTILAASYKNEGNFFAIDDYSQQWGGYPELIAHKNRFADVCKWDFANEDCWKIDHAKIPQPINCYFYDGRHEEEPQELALTHFEDVLADEVVYIVDDWNDRTDGVAIGTKRGISKINYDIVFHVATAPKGQHGDSANWWDGFGVYLLRKKA